MLAGNPTLATQTLPDEDFPAQQVFVYPDGEVISVTPSVLVVEDDANLRRLYELTLGSWQLPMDVTVVENGFAGLVTLGQRSPLLVIADLEMPGMDGFAMIRALMKHPERTFDLIVVSALPDEETRHVGGLPDGITVF